MLSLPGALLAAGDQSGQAGPLGLFIILALGAATVLLIRSMSRHLKRVPPTFDPPAKPTDPPDETPRQAG